jgi:hypothetical protein
MHATWDGWLAQRQLDDLGVVWCGTCSNTANSLR